jgi:single-strand DNA-binding protein
MASYNRVLLMGNLTRDPQLRYLPSQTAVADFGLAVNRRFKTAQGEDREEVTFVDCTAFGRQAEVINQYCQKGKAIFIEGRLKFDQWEDKQGGGKRSKHSVVIDNFQFVGARGDGGPQGAGEAAGGDQDQSQPRRSPPQRGPAAQNARGPRPQGQAPAPQTPSEPPFTEEQQFHDDDIPF